MALMTAQQVRDPYALTSADVENPPRSLATLIRKLGPGIILAGSIVGSGELIATTVLGAENGYTLLWLIVVSCVIKNIIQNELGRYAIGTGETTLEAFDRIPGPRLGVSWVVWLWVLMIAGTVLTIGAMLGAIGEVLNMLVPAVPINVWTWLIAAVSVMILLVGEYGLIEKISMVLVSYFTLMTVLAGAMLVTQPEYFSWGRVLEGFTFQRPTGGLLTAVAAFGITGAGSVELFMYPYWCIEKGYARFAGPRDDSTVWRDRARGWIRVMGVDIISSMALYTVSTVAFYLLGAGVLFGAGIVPEGSEMIRSLSTMYTETLGDWTQPLFLLGAVIILYSSVFAAAAAHPRMLADVAGMLGLYDKHDYRRRLRVTHVFVVIYLILPAVCYLFVGEPVIMVKLGGTAEALLLPVVGFSTIYLRYKHLPKAILPKGWLTLGLWVTSAVMAFMMAYAIIVPLL